MTAQDQDARGSDPQSGSDSDTPSNFGDSNFRAFGSPDKFAETISKLKSTKPVISTSSPNLATREQVLAFTSNLRRRINFNQLSDDQKASLGPGVCELLQKGAVSPKFDKNRKSELFLGTLTAGNIMDSIKDSDRSLTPRKLARALRNEILEISMAWSIPGNLSKKYLQSHPDATIAELVWASDFHTFSEDANMPEEVKNWLIENYTSRFEKNK